MADLVWGIGASKVMTRHGKPQPQKPVDRKELRAKKKAERQRKKK